MHVFIRTLVSFRLKDISRNAIYTMLTRQTTWIHPSMSRFRCKTSTFYFESSCKLKKTTFFSSKHRLYWLCLVFFPENGRLPPEFVKNKSSFPGKWSCFIHFYWINCSVLKFPFFPLFHRGMEFSSRWQDWALDSLYLNYLPMPTVIQLTRFELSVGGSIGKSIGDG